MSARAARPGPSEVDALVPVKSLDAAKSRLVPSLGRPGRVDAGRLVLAMLDDVLEALAAASRVVRMAVVTPDEGVARHAEAAGARALRIPDVGLNPSLDRAAAQLAGPEPRGLLVLLGDVAGATPGDLDALCEALDPLGRPAAVLCPSRDGGTTALLRAPHDALPSCFGPDSADRHREAAARRGLPLAERVLPSLAVDLDRPEDVSAFLSADGGGGRRTRALLRELGWGAEA
jgi:2-phospho-L-lactate guanylyltransferase